MSAQQFEGFAASPSEIKSVILTLPPGFTINPDAADGQSDCTDAQANFGSEGPAECPDNAKIGTFAIGSPTPQRSPERVRLYRRTRAEQPVPPLLDRLGLRNERQAGRLIQTQPRNRPTHRLLRKPAPAPLRRLSAPPLRRRTSADGHPDACTIYTVSADFFPWDEALADQLSRPGLRSRSWSPRQPNAPARSVPSTRAWKRAPRTPTAGAFSSFTLKLSREDGDQYLGNLNFTMPPGLTANLHGITYCPEASIAVAPQPSAAPSRPIRAARQAQKSAARTSPPAPAPTPSTRTARSTWPDPSRALRFRWSRSPLRSLAPTTTARSSFASPCTSTPSMPT